MDRRLLLAVQVDGTESQQPRVLENRNDRSRLRLLEQHTRRRRLVAVATLQRPDGRLLARVDALLPHLLLHRLDDAQPVGTDPQGLLLGVGRLRHLVELHLRDAELRLHLGHLLPLDGDLLLEALAADAMPQHLEDLI